MTLVCTVNSKNLQCLQRVGPAIGNWEDGQVRSSSEPLKDLVIWHQETYQFSFFSHLIGLNRLTIAENDCTWCAKVVKNFLFPFEDMIEGT